MKRILHHNEQLKFHCIIIMVWPSLHADFKDQRIRGKVYGVALNKLIGINTPEISTAL